MALPGLRLLRALRPLSSAALRRAPSASTPGGSGLHASSWLLRTLSSAPFRPSASLLDQRSDSSEGKFGPDDILFEGCDYNHWLITMDFPKDQKLTPEEMVETYVKTCAEVVGSREEAMKRMYACSTTTYTGFQVEMSEEMSEKFRGLPGVVFILPDSYIDPVNKQYGGDKYEMGKITPRPPPVQYGRQGRYGDRNRNYDRPRYDRQRDSVPVHGNQSFSPQTDGRNYVPQGNQSYSPHGPQGDGRNYGSPQGDGRNYGLQGEGRNNGPPQGDGRNFVPQQNYVPNIPQDGQQYDHGPMQADRRNYAPQYNYNAMGQQSMQHDRPVPPQAQGDRGNYAPQQNFNPYDSAQGDWRNYAPQQNYDPYSRNFSQEDYHPGRQQGHMPYSQQDIRRNHGAVHPPQQMYNPNGEPGNPAYGQQNHMGDTRYRMQQNYGPPSGRGREPSPSAQSKVYSQYSGEHQENTDSHQFVGNNQGQQ